jgi:hypothetical protein
VLAGPARARSLGRRGPAAGQGPCPGVGPSRPAGRRCRPVPRRQARRRARPEIRAGARRPAPELLPGSPAQESLRGPSRRPACAPAKASRAPRGARGRDAARSDARGARARRRVCWRMSRFAGRAALRLRLIVDSLRTPPCAAEPENAGGRPPTARRSPPPGHTWPARNGSRMWAAGSEMQRKRRGGGPGGQGGSPGECGHTSPSPCQRAREDDAAPPPAAPSFPGTHPSSAHSREIDSMGALMPCSRCKAAPLTSKACCHST